MGAAHGLRWDEAKRERRPLSKLTRVSSGAASEVISLNSNAPATGYRGALDLDRFARAGPGHQYLARKGVWSN